MAKQSLSVRYRPKTWDDVFINKRVERNDLENYLSNGFTEGRIKCKNEC